MWKWLFGTSEEEAREEEQRKNRGFLADLLGLGFWGATIALVGALAFQFIPAARNWLGDSENFGLQAFANKYLNWFSNDPWFPDAEKNYFLSADQNTAANLVEQALSGADDVTLGRKSIEALVGQKDSDARQSLMELLDSASFDFSSPNFTDESLELILTTALTDGKYHNYIRSVIDGAIQDVKTMRASGDEGGLRGFRQMLGLLPDHSGKESIFSDPDIIAALLSNEELAHTGVSLIGALSENEDIRTLLEGNEGFIVSVLQKIPPANAVELIEALKAGQFEVILSDEKFSAARNALFDTILQDNSFENNLSVARLRGLGLLGEKISEEQVALLITLLQKESEMGNGHTTLDVIAQLGKDDSQTFQAAIQMLGHAMINGDSPLPSPAITAEQQQNILDAFGLMDFDWLSEEQINMITDSPSTADGFVKLDHYYIGDKVLDSGFGDDVREGENGLYDLIVVNGIIKPTLQAITR
jgi:hypothetical protein